MKKPFVAVLMGSDSDLPVVREALETLEEFGVPFEINVFSAHRSPEDTVSYVKSAQTRGVRVFIAAAGGAAHLPGVVAAYTTMPVIGIPILSKSLGGIDSLYSIVQMPPGIPVATVGINAAKNAALLAIQILGLSDIRLTEALSAYKVKLKKNILEKNKVFQTKGWKTYGIK